MSHEGTYCLGVVCMYISILEVVTHNVSRGNILSWCCLRVHYHIGSCDSKVESKGNDKKKTLRKKSKALQKFCKNATTEIQMEPNGT